MTATWADTVAVSGTTVIDPADPVFDGHYPGFPILPGLFLLEHVHAVVRTAAVAEGMHLVGLDRAKFLRPVRPGDEVRVDATLTMGATDVTCVASVSTVEDVVADFRLRYAPHWRGEPS
jgi:3-hydroxyacyl-[acyl-carrier-protein] dehydratase